MRYLQWVLIGAVLAACQSAPTPPLATLPVVQPEPQTTAPTSVPLLTSPPTASIAPTLISSPIPTAGWIETPESLSPILPTSASSVFQLLELTSPLSPDGIARVMIQTTPGAQCSLDYRRPDGTLSHAEGLGPQLANPQGICWWTWKLWMGAKTPLSGIGRLTITVNGVWQFFDIVLK
jgi:hypothetical protein